jgi:proline iminopeptidase
MDFRPLLNQVSCPTLVLAGEKDPRIPPVLARMIADAIAPGLARFELLPGCGHGPHKDQPARVLEMLREFVLAPS